MRKHLYFVCPTDHLETVINDQCNQENYYLTSLGNSVSFNSEFIGEINSLIEANRITEVTFILSDNNRIILDALNRQRFNNVRGLSSFYNIIGKEKRLTKKLWHTFDIQSQIISCYLNLKVKELQFRLSSCLTDTVKVNGIIYCSKSKTFDEIQPNLLSLEDFNLN